MYRKTVPQSSFMPIFPSFPFWCFFFPSRNNVLIVYNSAVSVLMNYRSTFYSFRKVILGSESTRSLSFLKSLPGEKKKKTRNKARRFTNDALHSQGSVLLLLALQLRLRGLCSWTFFSYSWPRSLKSRKRHPCICLFSAECKGCSASLAEHAGMRTEQCTRNLQIQDQSALGKHLHCVGQWSKIVKL